MTPRPPLPRERLVEIPAGTELLRDLRFMPDTAFAEIADDELANAARWLRAAAHSAREGAIKLERIVRLRQEEEPPCTSDPTTTATNTSTEGRPPADQ